MRIAPGPIPTLAQLAEHNDWCWAMCALPCGHSAAVPLAAAIKRVGADATVDTLSARFICTVCGARKATFRTPSWTDMKLGWQPLPVDEIAIGLR